VELVVAVDMSPQLFPLRPSKSLTFMSLVVVRVVVVMPQEPLLVVVVVVVD
jgi:hypothetical protein